MRQYSQEKAYNEQMASGYDNSKLLKSEFASRKEQMENDLKKTDKEIEAGNDVVTLERQEVQDTVNEKQAATNDAINQKEKMIKNTDAKIRQTVKKRSEDGALAAVKDNLIETF
jgi:hypothetical protein